jgi:hypothetical protein
MMIGYLLVFTTVLQWRIFIVLNHDCDDQFFLLATVHTLKSLKNTSIKSSYQHGFCYRFLSNNN